MNRKSNPDLVRNINYMVRLNKPEDEAFHSLLNLANEENPQRFIREMITDGIVHSRISHKQYTVYEDVLSILIEYRTNFKRLNELIKNEDSDLQIKLKEIIHQISAALVRL